MCSQHSSSGQAKLGRGEWRQQQRSVCPACTRRNEEPLLARHRHQSVQSPPRPAKLTTRNTPAAVRRRRACPILSWGGRSDLSVRSCCGTASPRLAMPVRRGAPSDLASGRDPGGIFRETFPRTVARKNQPCICFNSRVLAIQYNSVPCLHGRIEVGMSPSSTLGDPPDIFQLERSNWVDSTKSS